VCGKLKYFIATKSDCHRKFIDNNTFNIIDSEKINNNVLTQNGTTSHVAVRVFDCMCVLVVCAFVCACASECVCVCECVSLWMCECVSAFLCVRVVLCVFVCLNVYLYVSV